MHCFKDECKDCKFCFKCITFTYPRIPDDEREYGDPVPQGMSECNTMTLCELVYNALTENVSSHPYYGNCYVTPAFLCPHPDTKEEYERWTHRRARNREGYTQIPEPMLKMFELIPDDSDMPRLRTAEESDELIPDSEVENWVKSVALEDYKKNLREAVNLKHEKEELDM